MNELDLVERIKSEEDTLCCLPFEPVYSVKRVNLTKLVNRHRGMLVDWLRSQRRPESPDMQDRGPVEGRVLVVESDVLAALLLRLVVENRGHCVRDAASAAEAVGLVRTWNPDVLVIDQSMTEVPGAEFIAHLKAQARCEPRIVLTGSKLRPVCGVEAVFRKPYEAEEVADKVDSLIGDLTEDALAILQCPARGPHVDARSDVLAEIWRRLTYVSTAIDRCDVECDEALDRIRYLLSLVEKRIT